MGLVAARRARDMLKISYAVPAVELVCACQAVDQRDGGAAKLSMVTRKIYDMVREVVPYLDHDESLTDHIAWPVCQPGDGSCLHCIDERLQSARPPH